VAAAFEADGLALSDMHLLFVTKRNSFAPPTSNNELFSSEDEDLPVRKRRHRKSFHMWNWHFLTMRPLNSGHSVTYFQHNKSMIEHSVATPVSNITGLVSFPGDPEELNLKVLPKDLRQTFSTGFKEMP
jgi:hypothetical protein